MSKAVYNSDVIDAVKEKLDGKYAKTDISEIKGAIEDVIKDFLTDGVKVQLKGFVTFETKRMEESVGRNPQTGESVKVEAHNKLSVKPSKVFKDSMR